MNRSIIYVTAAAALLAGCATHPQARPWWTLNEQSFAGIAPGRTSKQEVERQLGAPLLATVFRNLDEEVWDYRYLNGTRTYGAEVHFDMQGRAKYASTYPDLCPFGPVPCR